VSGRLAVRVAASFLVPFFVVSWNVVVPKPTWTVTVNWPFLSA
jgi:hypothetical protein